MQEALAYLSYFGIILLIGLLCSTFSKKLKMPNTLLLIIAGIILGNLKYSGAPLISFPQSFLTSMAIMALAMIVFDSASRLRIRQFDALSLCSLKLVLIFLVLCAVFLTFSTYQIFYMDSWLFALLFAVVMVATDPSVIMVALGNARSKVFQILEIESIINTPIVVLLPFMILDIIREIGSGISFEYLLPKLLPIGQQFVSGIGAGVLVGVIIFKIMRKAYSITLSPLAIVTAAILTYLLAEALGGNGILAVTTAGLFFGNVYIIHKKKLQEFSSTFSLFLEIIVFILIGMIIHIDITFSFLLSAVYLFIAYLLIRFLAVLLTFTPSEFNIKEKLFFTLNMPKGVAVAVVVLTLSTRSDLNIQLLLDLMVAFMIISIILSTIVTRYASHFTKFQQLKGD